MGSEREPQEDAENTFRVLSVKAVLFYSEQQDKILPLYLQKSSLFVTDHITAYCHCTVICVMCKIKTFKLFLVLYVVDIVSLHLVTKKFSKSIGKQLFYDY